ncbi:MarR family winged helix-turn-helix transcriptional regulator [Actinomadura oligospora]|uniref:MarR family winged helix-turn-helix transcriptional regulator n=1 Tax=Actinomadura oligospora TaxID=111804 RepID=UPI003CCBFDF4
MTGQNPHSLDPIAEAHRQWSARWPGHADQMAAVTSVMRAQQLLLSRIEAVLKPFGLTFAAYEALRLLAFTRTGTLPMGKMGERLMVHAASVTNVIGRLERRGLVGRGPSPADRRVVLATITADGRALAEAATAALHEADFGLPGLSPAQASAITGALRAVRASAGDLPPDDDLVDDGPVDESLDGRLPEVPLNGVLSPENASPENAR